MIKEELYLKDYDWQITIYYAVDDYYADEIMKEIDKYNPSIKDYTTAEKMLYNYQYNTGFTFTNFKKKKSLVVIGLTTTPEEFQSTFDHEKGHLAMHISKYYNIDPFSEDFQYLVGDIGKLLFHTAKQFICKHCYYELVSNFRKCK